MFLQHVLHVGRGALRPSTVGVRTLVFPSQEVILLVRHRLYPGWHLPGGAIDRGEVACDAAVREVHEEGGVQCPVESLKLIGVYANEKRFVSDHVLLYATSQGLVLPNARLDPEIAERGFFSLDDLPRDVSAATLRRIHEYQGALEQQTRW